MNRNRTGRKSLPWGLGSERGSALIMVVLVLLAVSGLAAAMLIMGQTDHLISANERDSERALFASKAGLAYAFQLYQERLLDPTPAGTPFDSFATAVDTQLDGAEFTGRLYELSTTQGQLYAVQSTGTFNRATRSTELIFQVVPESLKYGYIGFTEVALHNHSGLAGPSFRIDSTVYSNGNVGLPENLTLDGSVVSAETTSIDNGSIVKGSVYAHQVSNSGTIEGNVKLVTSVAKLPSTAVGYDRIDNLGSKYAWYGGNSTPGTLGGSGSVVGTTSSYTIQNGDDFNWEIIREDGSLIPDPDVNVVRYVPPPLIDYAAMKAEADKNDPTYFTSAAALYAYLATKKVTEVVGGYTVTTIRVGTPAKPEFIYLDDSFALELVPNAAGDSGNKLKAHGFVLEGGMYVSGDWEISEAPFLTAPNDYMPPPPDYYSFMINALPYCYPAMLVYPEPSSGTLADWSPADTPPIGGAGNVKMSSGSPNGGFSYINGMIFAGKEVHLHHTKTALELIRMNGAELASKVHNCDYLWFSYDPQVRCTKFLAGGEGNTGIVSYREIR